MWLLKLLSPSLFIIISLQLNGQVCTGSLGDAVININFGTGAGAGGALPASVTNYTYNPGDCPNDGSYTIINATNNCFGSTWHSYPEDHTTGDNNGRMMLVNSSLQPNDFYVDTVRNLCAGNTYEFSAWITNVIKPSSCNSNPTPPNLAFTIESTTGTILGSYNTNNISATNTPEWRQYGLFFTTGANPTIVIRLRNNAPGGCGNDLAIDDIAFRPCGPTVTTVVSSTNMPSADLCANMVQPIQLSAQTGNGYMNPSYQWQQSTDNGASWQDITGANTLNYTATPVSSGTYLYRLTVAENGNIGNPNCRVASNNTRITIRPNPVVVATSNQPVCAGELLQLQASGALQYSWTGPAGFTSNESNPQFTASGNNSGIYNISGADQFGCMDTAQITVEVLAAPVVNINTTRSVICTGDTVTLTASGADSYLWTPAAFLNRTDSASVKAYPAGTISYVVTGTSSNGCIDKDSVTINVFPRPTANAGPDKFAVSGNPVILSGSTNASNNTISWTPATYLNDATILQPTSTPLQDITYLLTVNSPNGCGSASDSVTVKIYNGLFVPNSFTPNADGKNDSWRIPALSAFPGATVQVFNRYGEIVYTFKNAADSWKGNFKGQPATSGSYVYLIDLKNEMPVLKGSLLLLR